MAATLRFILRGDLGRRQPLQMAQLDCLPLVVRKLGDGIGQSSQLLVTNHPLAGRRLLGGQDRLEVPRRLLQRRFQGSFPTAGFG